MLRYRLLGRFCLTSLFVCLLVGCGDGGGRHHVSGNATFAGKPIPTGKIYFTPDASKGNSGAAGWADIQDGKFDTKAPGGQATIGGPMLVRIEGADGVRIDEERPNGNPLFPFYETQVDLPKSSSTRDFDVPAEAVNYQPPSAEPAIIP